MDLRTDDFDYELPPARIAQTPVEPRDTSRLLVVHRAGGVIEHRRFREIGQYLQRGDLLVANDSRVLAGRLWAHKPTGGRVELLLLRELDAGWWEALARPVHRLRPGQRLELVQAPDTSTSSALASSSEGARSAVGSRTAAAGASPRVGPLEAPSNDEHDGPGAPAAGEPDQGVQRTSCEPGIQVVEVGERTPAGGVRLRFAAPLEQVMARYGHMPLPPYIRTPLADPERYQTVYARVTGSAAAPTAGLHFTPDLLDALSAMGVQLAFVTLHVGPDTFRPVRATRIVDHQMHAEFASVPPATAAAITEAKRAGRRVIAVGTTAVRALESWAAGWNGWTRLFIYPGYEFRVVDALVTNFHLPRSTLLMLISAFAGRDLVRRAYREAIVAEYRFYSFGDCCLFL